MGNLNRWVGIARVTRDPEVRMFANGGAVVSLGLALNERKKNKDSGQYEDVPIFIDAKAFNSGSYKLAEIIGEHVKKGTQLGVEGKLALDQWEDKNGGGKRSKLYVVIDSFQFCGGERKAGGGSNGKPAGARRAAPAGEPADEGNPFGDSGGDPQPEIPF